MKNSSTWKFSLVFVILIHGFLSSSSQVSKGNVTFPSIEEFKKNVVHLYETDSLINDGIKFFTTVFSGDDDLQNLFFLHAQEIFTEIYKKK